MRAGTGPGAEPASAVRIVLAEQLWSRVDAPKGLGIHVVRGVIEGGQCRYVLVESLSDGKRTKIRHDSFVAGWRCL